MKVLVIDDSRTMRSILKRILVESMGYSPEDVCEAADGVEAMSAVSTTPFDLFLLDWNMPNMDGITFLRSLRAAGVHAPVIMCTTEGEKSRVIQAITAGASNYIIKPMDPGVVKQKIEHTLQKYAAAAK